MYRLHIYVLLIHHFNQNFTADAKMYHIWLYVKCEMIYEHICTQFWRSVSVSGHGNAILNKLPRPTRVRIRPGQCTRLLAAFSNRIPITISITIIFKCYFCKCVICSVTCSKISRKHVGITFLSRALM